MTRNAPPMPGFFDSTTSSRSRTIIYWIATILLVLECEVGGIMGDLRLQPFLGTDSHHLVYPWWCGVGLSALPPTQGEWAYACLLALGSRRVGGRSAHEIRTKLVKTTGAISIKAGSPTAKCDMNAPVYMKNKPA